MISADLVPDIVEKVFGLIKRTEKEEKSSGEAGQQPEKTSETMKVESGKGVSISSQDNTGDTLSSDSLNRVVSAEEEIVVLQRDQMISIGVIEIINLDYKSDNRKDLKNDSLLAETAEIKPEPRITETKVSWTLEYWSSPVNYKGYRIGNNKFILFGIDPDAPLKAYLFNGKFFLKSNEGVFELEYSGDFQPFMKTVNSAALSAIGNKS